MLELLKEAIILKEFFTKLFFELLVCVSGPIKLGNDWLV